MIDDLQEVVQRFAACNWNWEAAHWPEIVAALQLEATAQVGERRSYRFVNGTQLDAYFDGPALAWVEVTVEAFLHPDELDETGYDDRYDEFYDFFEKGVGTAQKLLGNPVFCDGAAAKGFPEDQAGAEFLALWRLPNARLMIQFRHEDRELPFRICGLVAPPA